MSSYVVKFKRDPHRIAGVTLFVITWVYIVEGFYPDTCYEDRRIVKRLFCFTEQNLPVIFLTVIPTSKYK